MEFNLELVRRVVSYIDLPSASASPDCARTQPQRLLSLFSPESQEFQIIQAIIAHSKELYAALHAPFPALTERKCAAFSCDTSAKEAVEGTEQTQLKTPWRKGQFKQQAKVN